MLKHQRHPPAAAAAAAVFAANDDSLQRHRSTIPALACVRQQLHAVLRVTCYVLRVMCYVLRVTSCLTQHAVFNFTGRCPIASAGGTQVNGVLVVPVCN